MTSRYGDFSTGLLKTNLHLKIHSKNSRKLNYYISTCTKNCTTLKKWWMEATLYAVVRKDGDFGAATVCFSDFDWRLDLDFPAAGCYATRSTRLHAWGCWFSWWGKGGFLNAVLNMKGLHDGKAEMYFEFMTRWRSRFSYLRLEVWAYDCARDVRVNRCFQLFSGDFLWVLEGVLIDRMGGGMQILTTNILLLYLAQILTTDLWSPP